MSIQSEINRIKGNVDDTLSALSDAGVAVPANANSNDLPELVSEAVNAIVPVERGGTGATAVRDAAHNLSVPSLLGGTAIPKNADLNDYKTVGTYHSETYKSTSNLANCPTNNPFTMTVSYACGSSWYTSQEIVDFQEGVRYFRMGTGSGTWYNWQTSYSTAYKPSADGLSGNMTVAKGGTGRTSLTSGYYLVGNGTGAVTLKTKAQVLSDIDAVSTATFNALLARVAALESGGGGTWQFTFNHQNFSFENGMTWGEFVDSTHNETVWCPECGEGYQAFYIDWNLDERDGSPVFYSESGSLEDGCGCTSPIRLPVASTDTVYPMDYDLIMKALSSGGGGGNITFTYDTGDEEHTFTVPAGTTWGQFLGGDEDAGIYEPTVNCDYGGHETPMFMTYNDASGGDGDDRICGYRNGLCASCWYSDEADPKFVYYDNPDEGYEYVYADDTIVNGGYYHAGSEM